MGSEQHNSGHGSSGVWPEERLRQELDVRGRPVERLVGELGSDFGVRLLSQKALLNIERALATQEIAVTPTPLPVDPLALVSLRHDPDVEPSPGERGEPEGDLESAAYDEWKAPTEPWELTAPESYVLRYGKHGYGHVAFKLAVMELVARGALEIVSVRRHFPGWPWKRHALCAGRRRYSVTEHALLPALELYDEVGKKAFVSAEGGDRLMGVAVERFARAAARRYKASFTPYHEGVLMHLLEQRDLAKVSSRDAVLFTMTNFSRTASGRAADDELQAWLSGGRKQLRELLATDRSQARAYAATAGSVLLLMDDLTARLASLAPAGSELHGPNVAAFDLDTPDRLDLSAFHSFDAIAIAFAPIRVARGGRGG